MAGGQPSGATTRRARGNRNPSQTLPPGSHVGRYEIGKVLRLGYAGVTYRARDTTRGGDVALKEYLPVDIAARRSDLKVVPRLHQHGDDFAWGRERFLAEARMLAALAVSSGERVPGILGVDECLEANGTAYVVAPLPSRDTLASRLSREGPLTPDQINRLVPPLLEGLSRAHAAGILHLDIKPANIVLDDQGVAYLFDFDGARAALATRLPSATSATAYAALEQVTSAPTGPFTDIYALAATLYECICGVAPPSAMERPGERLVAVPRKTAKAHDPRLLSAIQAGLALQPADRPASIAAWRAMMEATTAAPHPTPTIAPKPTEALATSVIPQARPPAAARGTPRSWERWQIALAATLAFAVIPAGVAGDYVAFPPSSPTRPSTVVATADLREAPDAQAVGEALARRLADQVAEIAAAEAAYRQMAEHDAAHRNQVADEAQARLAAAADAHRRIEAEHAQAAAAQAQAEADARQAAAAAEATLKLSDRDRRRAQVALTSLGHDTYGADGLFGPRTRKMIAAWQKSRGAFDSGYLIPEDLALLWIQAAPALARYEQQLALEEQRRQEEKRLAKEAATPTPETDEPTSQ